MARKSSRLFLLAITAWLLTACGTGSGPGTAIDASAPSAAGTAASSPSPRDQATRQQLSPDHPSPADPVNIKLIPYKGEVGFEIQVPDGWKVQPTALGDLVRFYGKPAPVKIDVQSTQLRGAPIPRTVEEMKRSSAIASVSPHAVVKSVQVSGAQSAFEVMYKQLEDQGEITYLERYLFGRTRRQVLTFTVPTALYPQWEPVFRQIIQSFQPMNLDAGAMPGRP